MHGDIGARGRLQQDHLIEADDGPAVGNGAGNSAVMATGFSRPSKTTKSSPKQFILRKEIAPMLGLYGNSPRLCWGRVAFVWNRDLHEGALSEALKSTHQTTTPACGAGIRVIFPKMLRTLISASKMSFATMGAPLAARPHRKSTNHIPSIDENLRLKFCTSCLGKDCANLKIESTTTLSREGTSGPSRSRIVSVDIRLIRIFRLGFFPNL